MRAAKVARARTEAGALCQPPTQFCGSLCRKSCDSTVHAGPARRPSEGPGKRAGPVNRTRGAHPLPQPEGLEYTGGPEPRDVIPVTPCRSTVTVDYCTFNFHNFKPQNFKLSVSNPNSKYVAYLYVLSNLSRKNKHDILAGARSCHGNPSRLLVERLVTVSPFFGAGERRGNRCRSGGVPVPRRSASCTP